MDDVGFWFLASLYFVLQCVGSSETLCVEQIPLDCCRAWVCPTKAKQLFRNGKELIVAALLFCVEESREGVTAHYIHIWAAWTRFRMPCDGTHVSPVPCASRFVKQLYLGSAGLVPSPLRVTFGPHRKIRIKTERNFLSHQVLSPAVEGNHIIWCLSNTYLVPSWNHLGFLPSLLLLRGCLSSHGYKPSSHFQPKYVQGSLSCL